ncbi:flagellar biosynthesis protein FlhA [Petroclostridium sp. X23]|uniref:flagellar biosynthesis protein FlhA n=1 Tax=Petroclostridium sp. X23 TaxID=3045146 RepID=UPI0024AE0FB0|nr:flagellar biosynthesis protein FlhA [Petroclostridium sp. X23]WHH58952.1 flagellar biosynthesis protein FlhA [Petroclostridium sp. X23]
MKFKDIAVAIIIIAIILIIIIPVPPGLLDILLAINISLAVVILLNTIYAEDALGFSVFPSLLLITTLYRLALNISSTKLILSTGDPGNVVTAFATFVIQGNVVVGFIVFLIITIVQFLVITKGSERVSEVAARFTLDAMPGKQMAIDADLNAGLINDIEAKERRKNIQREADFYGAMDGASKFVKGDAIAGIIITVINIIAGFIMGAMRQEGQLASVLNKYTNLTVGDGLVSQIPALLISTATGIIVTRAASDSNLGNDLIKQIFQNPMVMFLASGVAGLMAIIPGLPFLPFLILAIMLAIAGYNMRKTLEQSEMQEEIEVEESEVEEIRKPENVVSLLQIDPIELEFGYGIIPLADVNQGGDLLDRVVMIRRQLALELGIVVPIIRLRDNIQLSPNEYVIKIKGVEVSTGELMFDHYLAMNPGTVDEDIDGIKTVEPAFGLPAIWINESQRERAEILGYTVVDPPSIIATHLTEIIKKYAHELLSRQDVQALIDNLKHSHPALVEELVPKQMSIGEVQKVLANLLKEGISVRDLASILETLADYVTVTRDSDMLTEYVRQGLGRSICSKFIGKGRTNVITLDPKLEQKIMDAVQSTEHGSYLTLDPNYSQEVVNRVYKQVQKILATGQQPIILTSPVVRLYFKRLTEQAIPGLIVLSYNELDPAIEIQSIGMVSV